MTLKCADGWRGGRYCSPVLVYLPLGQRTYRPLYEREVERTMSKHRDGVRLSPGNGIRQGLGE